EDVEFLDALGLPWENVVDKAQWLVIHELPLPTGYTQDKTALAIRIETGYPHAALDMAYFRPAIVRQDGRAIAATDAKQSIDGTEWQRWSRHRTTQNPWRPGVDNIESHFLLIKDWLEREFKR
ncbi:MAG TPA: E2/UBC family protein, partial [Candidatus Hydrogenedentes bacterium]|nr:E2/UBC family protein [Candidatus Hydrogenedentota bacterium]